MWKRTLLSECSWWVKTSSLLHQLELAKAHLSVVDISLVEKTTSHKRIELTLSIYIYNLHKAMPHLFSMRKIMFENPKNKHSN